MQSGLGDQTHPARLGRETAGSCSKVKREAGTLPSMTRRQIAHLQNTQAQQLPALAVQAKPSSAGQRCSLRHLCWTACPSCPCLPNLPPAFLFALQSSCPTPGLEARFYVHSLVQRYKRKEEQSEEEKEEEEEKEKEKEEEEEKEQQQQQQKKKQKNNKKKKRFLDLPFRKWKAVTGMNADFR